MSISADDRHRLRLRFEQVLGPDEAAIVMEAFPPAGWDPATLQGDVTNLRSDAAHLQVAMGELRLDLRELEHRLRSDLRDLERRLTDHTDLRVRASVGESTRTMVFAMLASQATLVGMVLAAVKLA